MLRRLAPILLAALASTSLASSALGDEPGFRPPWWPRPRPVDVRPIPSGFSLDVVDEVSRPLPAYYHRGDRWILGTLGQRYRIHLRNPTGERVEAVVSVDGLDALDGRSAGFAKRGYVLPPYGELTIDGFRTSLNAVAAFRFSSVRDSYAGRKGDDRNVGVIGVAFFRERAPVVVPTYPWRRDDAPSADRGGGSAPAPSHAPHPSPPRSSAGTAEARKLERPGIGTAFGEQRESRVNETSFERESARPVATLQVRYDDREGLRAQGIAVPPPYEGRHDEARRREAADPFPGSRFASPPP